MSFQQLALSIQPMRYPAQQNRIGLHSRDAFLQPGSGSYVSEIQNARGLSAKC